MDAGAAAAACRCAGHPDADRCSRHRRLAAIARHVAAAPGAAARGCVARPAGWERVPVSRRERNWGGGVMFQASRVAVPRSMAELRDVVRDAAPPVRVLGRGHSFSPVCAVPGGTLVSLAQMSRVLRYEPPGAGGQPGSVTVEGGCTYADLLRYLAKCSPPAALRNLPSPVNVTIAGAMATSTHGSGVHNQNLASQVSALQLVTADGSLIEYDRERNPDALPGCVVSLGCQGVVSRLTIDVVPSFRVHNFVIVMPIEHMIEHWHYLAGDSSRPGVCDSFSNGCMWQRGLCRINMKHFVPHYDPRVAAPPARYGAGPFRAVRWELLAGKAADLAATARSVGVTLRAGGAAPTVASVEPESVAHHAGVGPSWALVQLGAAPTAAAARRGLAHVAGFADGGAAAAAFAALPAEGFVVLAFDEDPAGQRRAVPTRRPITGVAYRGEHYDNLPAVPLGVGWGSGELSGCGQQAEFFLPFGRSQEALRAAYALIRNWAYDLKGPLPWEEGGPVSNGAEIRTIKGDAQWLSCSPHDTTTIHINLNQHPARRMDVRRHLAELERVLAPLGARPHWGKLFNPESFDFGELYGDRLRRFRRLAARHDPEGKFRTRWIRDVLFDEGGEGY